MFHQVVEHTGHRLSVCCLSLRRHTCTRRPILRLPTCLQDSESELDLRFKALSRAEPDDQPQQPPSPTGSPAPQVEAPAAAPESSEGMQPLSPDSEASGPALQRTANTPAAAADLPRVRVLSDIFYTSEDLDAEEMPAKYVVSRGAAEGAEALLSVPSAQEAQAGVSGRLAEQVRVYVTGRGMLQLQVCRRGAGRHQPCSCTGASSGLKSDAARGAAAVHMRRPWQWSCGLAWYLPAAGGKPHGWALWDVLVALLPPGLELAHALEASAHPCATVQENGAGLLDGKGRPSAANGGSELAAAPGLSPDAVLGRKGGNPKQQAAPPVGPGQMGSSPQVGEISVAAPKVLKLLHLPWWPSPTVVLTADLGVLLPDTMWNIEPLWPAPRLLSWSNSHDVDGRATCACCACRCLARGASTCPTQHSKRACPWARRCRRFWLPKDTP